MEEMLTAFKDGKLSQEQTIEKLNKLMIESGTAYYKSGYTDGYNAKKNENSGIGYFPGFVEG